MTPARRIIFANRFYWPDQPATAQLLVDLAEALAAAGLLVTVVASRPADAAVPSREMRNGVAIVRAGGRRMGQKNLLGRAADFMRFVIRARREIARVARPGDTLIAMTDPPLLGAALASLTRRKNLRLIHWIQDVFPEVAMAAGFRAASLTRAWRDRAWRSADMCVALGHDMAALVAERGVPADRIRVSPNWAPEGLSPASPTAAADLRARWGLTGKFVVLYSGNLGRVHDFSAIVPLANSLRDDPAFAFVFIGDGARRVPLESEVRDRGLTNVHFHPAQPRTALSATLALGDVHLVTLRDGCERLVFPSKLYGIAAVGRPVVFHGPRDSEIARLIETNGFGRAFAHGEVAEAASYLRALAADPSRREILSAAAVSFADREGRLRHAVARWHEWLAGKPLAGASPETSARGRPS